MTKQGIVNPAISPLDQDELSLAEFRGDDDLEANFPSLISSQAPDYDYGAISTLASGDAGPSRVLSPTTSKKEKGYISGVKKEHFGFDINFVKRFYLLQRVLFTKTFSVSSALFFFLLCLTLLQEYIVYQVGLIPSGYYMSLGMKDLPEFWMQTMRSMLLILAVAFVNSTALYVQKVLAVTFRKILCRDAHRLYFADIRFYQMNVLDKAIDNPDQRMTQDINKFCTTYCEVLPKLIVSPFTIGYYCYQGYRRSGWQGPVGCFGYFLFGVTINKFLMSPIINFVVKQEKCEGDFRFLHMLVRVHSEPIAFQRASVVEHGKVDDALNKLADTQHALYVRQYSLNYFVNFFDYVGSIFSYLMLAIMIFSGEYDNITAAELSVLISQNAFILMYLIFTFTSVVDLAGKFTDVAGVTHRISQLFERLSFLEEYWRGRFPPDHDKLMDTSNFDGWNHRRQKIRERLMTTALSIKEKNGAGLGNGDEWQRPQKLVVWSMDNVSFAAPNTGEPLVSNMNLEMVVGESIFISGDSSAGKTSLLRLLRGLWPTTRGSLKRHYPPGPHGVYFCTQKSYLTWGTLREQISFPLLPDGSHLDDKLILHYLDRLKLTHILERVGGLDVSCSWSVYDSLSPGEMQRLCLLRVFYHQPVVAILDEVTSALPFNMEEFIYSELRRIGITMISVGHRQSIRKYHDKQLTLDSEGGWSLHLIVEKGDAELLKN